MQRRAPDGAYSRYHRPELSGDRIDRDVGRIYWLCFSPDSKYAYLAVRSKKKVCVVDTATKKIVGYAEVGNTPKRNLVIPLEVGEGKASK